LADGEELGPSDGASLGEALGLPLGKTEGASLGVPLGLSLGDDDGDTLGVSLGEALAVHGPSPKNPHIALQFV
jgi:hypothetical protein